MLKVKKNIRYFKRLPFQVTLFGQSAGGQSTAIHLMSPGSAGLFTKAIIESAPFDIPFKSRVEALYLASTIVKLLNCTDAGDQYMSCLRSKTADQLAEAQHTSRKQPTSLKLLEFFEPLGPYVDGDVVPSELIKAAYADKLRKVPLMIGTVSEEARVFVYEAWGKPLTTAEYVAVAFGTYPKHVADILVQYPPAISGDQRDLLSRCVH